MKVDVDLKSHRFAQMNTDVMVRDHLCSPVLICGLRLFLALAIFFAASTTGVAQQIASGISTKEAFIDSQVVFQIRIATSGNSLNEFAPPKPSKVDGLEIATAGAPARSSSIRIVNGRRSSSTTLTYNYLVTPKREGTFTLPPVEVTVDGKQLSTKAHTFVVSKSETGDLLFVEIEGETKQAYVGEAVKLTLKVWVRGFSDRKQRIQLGERHMWQSFNQARTQWGTFAERLKELATERKRPAGQDVLRKDTEGVSRAYLLYEIESTMYPKRPGQIDPGNVRVVVDYPTKISRPRSSFGGSIFGPSFLDEMMGGGNPVQASRPISAEATLPPIQIIDVPSKGRPADYRGAVGKYKLLVESDTKQVKVGEPIGLRIYIQGDGPMELVEAPPLATLADLNQDFKVEDKALAGFVQDDKKVFATSIRPRHEDLTEIPPIPFSFFDPDERAFQTVYSAAIPISVEANESLSMDSIVANKKPAKSPTKSDDRAQTEKESGLLGVSEMLRESVRSERSPIGWIAFGLAPLLCLVGLVVARRSAMATWLARKKDPLYAIRSRIQTADTASEIRDALGDSKLGSNEALQLIATECDQLTFSPNSSGSHRKIEVLKEKALSVLSSQSLLSVCLLCLILYATSSAAAEPTLSLSKQQAETVLQEAHAAQVEAKEQVDIDPANAKSLLSLAINKYELVADSGHRSFGLQMNLGNAYLQNGDFAKSLAAFETARRVRPSSIETANRISAVRKAMGSEAAEETSSFRDALRLIPRNVFWWIGLISWTVFWIAVAIYLFVSRVRRRLVIGVAVSMLCVVALAFAALTSSKAYSYDAIALVDGAELRAADGEGFEVLHVVRLGEPLLIDGRRGSWLHVKDTHGEKRGWVKANDVTLVDG